GLVFCSENRPLDRDGSGPSWRPHDRKGDRGLAGIAGLANGVALIRNVRENAISIARIGRARRAPMSIARDFIAAETTKNCFAREMVSTRTVFPQSGRVGAFARSKR